MDVIFAGTFFLIAILAIWKWRLALYLAVVIDSAGDPLRKLVEPNTTFSIVVVVFLWVLALAGAYRSEAGRLVPLFATFPRLRTAIAAQGDCATMGNLR